MPSPNDDARCLRCATPLSKSSQERAIEDALGLESNETIAEPDGLEADIELDASILDESFAFDEQDALEPSAVPEAATSEDELWHPELSPSETRRLLGQSLIDGDLSHPSTPDESFASLLQSTAQSFGTLSNQTPGSRQAWPKSKDSAPFTRMKSLAAWSAICLGLMAFACGGVLLGWSVLGQRTELWSLGVPITLVGQVALLVGLCLQLDRLWSENRDTSERLGQMDEQLEELRQTTRLMGTPYHSASQSFYAHLSEGASPKMLLSDLKGQIDLLAVRMSQQEDRR